MAKPRPPHPPVEVKGPDRLTPGDLPFLRPLSPVWVMGVLNASPDSFYAGARIGGAEEAVAAAERLAAEGADLIDIGGESTRPGAEPVPEAVELARVLPVIEALRRRWPQRLLSIDTRKAAVARECLARGVSLLNDISALRHDPAMAEVAASARVPVVLMHMQGTPPTMQQHPAYGDVVADIRRFFEERMAFATARGIAEERILLDPGIGFGKTITHNLMILHRLSEFRSLGRPLLIGVSRKSFLGRIASDSADLLPPEDRLEPSLAAGLWAVQQGAAGLRVHDVAATRRALRVWEALQSPEAEEPR